MKKIELIISIPSFLLILTIGYILSQDRFSPISRFEHEGKTIDELLEICGAIPNGTTKDVFESTELFINLPEDLYPYENRQFILNGATADLLGSSDAPQVQALDPKKEKNPFNDEKTFKNHQCKAYLYQFSGQGRVTMVVKSKYPKLPNYSIQFYVHEKEP